MTKGTAYDFPLRPDFLAQIVIPRDLTTLEARRLGAFLMTLAVGAQSGDEENEISKRHAQQGREHDEHMRRVRKALNRE